MTERTRSQLNELTSSQLHELAILCWESTIPTTSDEHKRGFEAGRHSLLGKYATDDNVGLIFAKLDREKREAEIRLYGVLWYLWENEVISQGKALELAHKPLNDMIDECVKFRDHEGSISTS